MFTINISLNETLLTLLKKTIPHKGYNNISEYIRDLVRRDLRLEGANYPYDEEYLAALASEAAADVKAGRIKELKSWEELASSVGA